MYYAELPARPGLQLWVAAHWHFRVAADAGEIQHTVPLTGGVLFHVHNREPGVPILTGPRLAPLQTRVCGGDEFWGSQLWPGAAGSLLGLDPEELREAIVPAAQVLDPNWTRSLADRLTSISAGSISAGSISPDPEDAERRAAAVLDDAWQELAERAAPLDREVMGAVFRILRSAGEEPVARLAEHAGLSPRHFRRRFRAAVGLAPKELARLRRLRTSAVDRAHGADPWVDLAARRGYADQAHLVREYRSLLGLTPTGFERHARRITHARILT